MSAKEYRKCVHNGNLLAEDRGNKTFHQEMTVFETETLTYKPLSGMTTTCRCVKDRELQASCDVNQKLVPEWFQPLACWACWDSDPIADVAIDDTDILVPSTVRRSNSTCELGKGGRTPIWFRPLCCSGCWEKETEAATLINRRRQVNPEAPQLEREDLPKKQRIEEGQYVLLKEDISEQSRHRPFESTSKVSATTPATSRTNGLPVPKVDPLTSEIPVPKKSSAVPKPIIQGNVPQSGGNSHKAVGTITKPTKREQHKFWSKKFDNVELLNDLPWLDMLKLNFQVRGKEITVGSGSFGTVRLGEYLSEKGKLVVAIKELNSDLGGYKRQSCMNDLYMEGQILHHLQHTGVTPQFHGFLFNHHTMSIGLVEEFVGHSKTLAQVLLDGSGVFDKAQWRHICLCLVAGLVSIHESGVLINDIKLDNVLVVLGKGRALPKVTFIDFGNATYKGGDHFGIPLGRDPVNTCFPPEVARENQRTSPSSDVYSMGLVFESIYFFARVGNLEEAIDACLAENPNDRPTALELLRLLFSSF